MVKYTSVAEEVIIPSKVNLVLDNKIVTISGIATDPDGDDTIIKIEVMVTEEGKYKR